MHFGKIADMQKYHKIFTAFKSTDLLKKSGLKILKRIFSSLVAEKEKCPLRSVQSVFST